MRYLLIPILFFLLPLNGQAQKGYTAMTKAALTTMWKYQGTDTTGFDTTGYQLALSRYEEAFEMYPDSINSLGMYKASVLSGKLGLLDKAFGYLEVLTKFNETEIGGWDIIAGKYAKWEYDNLLDDPRWPGMLERARKQKKAFHQELNDAEQELLASQPWLTDTTLSGKTIYQQIRGFTNYLPKTRHDFSVTLPMNDSTNNSYFVHLPPGYNQTREYPVLVFLHGAVRWNRLSEYRMADDVLSGWNRFYTQYADSLGVILVFPKGSKQYNWMTSDDGFFMVPAIVRQLKQSLNINDDKVFITGHSNGATGSFSYLVKQPSPYAGFYGFNTYPKVFTGGTFAENAQTRSFLNFSTDEDYYYPPSANDDLTKLMGKLDVDYRDIRFNGFPHWFPEFDESEEAYQHLFTDLIQRERNPFPAKLSWEFDDNAYGTVDWLADMTLDTSASRANWQQPYNFPITEWLEYDDNDSLVTLTVDKQAFDLPRKSGKIKAEYDNNTFRLKTSRIGALTVLISPEMVDMKRPVQMYVNDVLKFEGQVDYDKPVILERFAATRDRRQVWVNALRITL